MAATSGLGLLRSIYSVCILLCKVDTLCFVNTDGMVFSRADFQKMQIATQQALTAKNINWKPAIDVTYRFELRVKTRDKLSCLMQHTSQN